ncbi:MAG: TolC family protein [Chitinophagaceae bacterium]|nr:TolC family protein [Chitinophagaceae bacterium]
MKSLRYIFFYCFIFCGSALYAQVLTPEEAVATALQNNYEIRLSRNDSIIAAIDYSYANAAMLPQVSGNGGLLFNNNNQKQKLADGTDRKANGIKTRNLTASLALEWVVFDGFKMFITRDKLKEAILFGDLTVKNQIVDVVSDVLKTYYNIVRQKQQLKAVVDQMELNRDRLKLAQVKLEVGLGIKPDVLQAQLDLNAQVATQLRQETLIAQTKGTLNRLMAVEKGVDYDVFDSIPIDTTLTLADIKNNITETSPQLLLTKKGIDLANYTLRERRAERLPTVSFVSAYNFSQTNNSTVINTFSALYNQNRGFNYGLNVSVPIFNNYITKRNIRQAQADIDFRRLTLESQASQLVTNVENNFRAYELQMRELKLEETNITLAKENVFIAFERYKQGVATVLELREAQKSLSDASDRLIAARYETKVAETELLRLKGNVVIRQ